MLCLNLLVGARPLAVALRLLRDSRVQGWCQLPLALFRNSLLDCLRECCRLVVPIHVQRLEHRSLVRWAVARVYCLHVEGSHRWVDGLGRQVLLSEVRLTRQAGERLPDELGLQTLRPVLLRRGESLVGAP